MSYGLNYEGLRKRESYDEIIDYIQNKQETIKFPDRVALQLRNSPELSNLLDSGGTGILDLEQQQKDQTILIEREHAIREAASQMKLTAQLLRHTANVPIDPNQFEIASDDGVAESSSELIEAYDDVNLDEERARVAKMSKTANIAMKALKATGQIAGVSASVLGKTAYYITKGAYNMASGVYEGANALEGGGEEDTEAPSTYAATLGSFGGSGSSNDDLNGLKVEELRTLARRYDYKSEGVTPDQLKGKGEGGLRRDNLISLIGKMRG